MRTGTPIFCALAVSCLAPLLLAQTATTITVGTYPNPSAYGAPVTLTATVTPASATGYVTFYDGVTIWGAKTVSAGTAAISTILLGVGVRQLRAYYGGDSTHAASITNPAPQTVNAAVNSGLALKAGPVTVLPGSSGYALVVGEL
jgi:hypothetical protein